MGTLYIATDFYCPGAYSPAHPPPGAETYDHLAGTVFAVVQPLLSASAGSIGLTAYLKLDGAGLAADHQIVFLNDRLPTDLIANIKSDAVPVPLPPLTQLALNWTPSASGAPLAITRTIPTSQVATGVLTSPLLLKLTDWPNFAQANHAQPPITSHADLLRVRSDRLPGIEADLTAWCAGLALAIVKLKRKNGAASLDPARAAAYRLLSDLDTQHADALTVQEALDYLKSPAPGDATPRFGRLWERMLLPDALTATQPILAPRVLHDETSLARAPNLAQLMDLVDTGSPFAVSYHQKVWRDMTQLIARSPPGQGSADQERPAAQALGRLFGFGERLRWPMGQLTDADFLPLDENAVRGAQLNWPAFGTNAHSLLGLLFRLPAHASDDVSHASVTLSVAGTASPDLGDALRALLPAAPIGPAAQVGRDADRPKGYFFYTPKMADFTAAPAPAGAGSVFATPAAILDALDPSARWHSPPGAADLAVYSPPRAATRASELYRPELAGAPPTRRLVISVRVATVPMERFKTPTGAFELRLADRLHAGEATEIVARFVAVAQDGGELWLTQKSGGVASWDLSGQVLNVATTDGETVVAVQDRQDRSLAVALANLQATAGPTPADEPKVDLVLAVSPGTDPLFNRAFGGLISQPGATERPPLAMLNQTFASRVSASTDRLMERFEAAFTPAPPRPGGPHSAIDQLANFNKARLALSSGAVEVIQRAPRQPQVPTFVSWLTYPDAIVPMPVTGYVPGAPPWAAAAPPTATRQFGYYTPHVFTQDASNFTGDAPPQSDDDAGGEDNDPRPENAAESLRYINYLTPATPWDVTGYLEHQYSQRIPFGGPALQLALATDVRHPGESTVFDPSATAATASRAALLQWGFPPGPGVASAIELDFPRRYADLASAKPSDASARPSRLRALYEPLADLIAVIDRGAAQLRLERWSFHTDGPDGGDPRVADRGALTASMRLVGAHLRDLKPTDPALAPLKLVRDLLAGPFDAFEDAMMKLGAGTDDNWLSLTLPLDQSWSDLPDPGVVFSDSDVLRLGLSLRRDDTTVVAPTFLDPAHLDKAPGFGLPVDAGETEDYPELGGERFAPLLEAAARELYAYLDPATRSAARQRFAWLSARPPAPAAGPAPSKGDPEATADPRRFERLFGQVAPTLIDPPQRRPQVDRVLDFYFVPLAFRPLRPHPRITDTETTLEFAEFLARVLDDLCNGRAPHDYTPAAEAVTADAYGAVQALRSKLAPAVAGLMKALVAPVHNAALAQGAGAGKYPQFVYVDGLAGTVLAQGAAEALQKMLSDTPGLFSSAKGFGLGIAEPSSWTDQTYALQLRKHIRKGWGPVTTAPIGDLIDVEQFQFPRLLAVGTNHTFIDVLDDARYEDVFAIEASTFNPPRAPWTPDTLSAVSLGARTLVARGQMQARTGEDAIEQAYRFDSSMQSQRRPLEADVLHWNPSWALTDHQTGQSHSFYLLPSRSAPSTPVKLKPLTDGPDSAPRCPLLLSFAGSGSGPDLNALLASLIEARLEAKSQVSFGSLSAARQATPVYAKVDRQDGGDYNAPGWWHVESYASEHYFVVETDEDPDQPFVNDQFRIEVALGPSPFPDEQPSAPAPIAVTGKLGAWFNYGRMRLSQPTATIATPSPVALTDVTKELTAWLTPPNPEDGLLVPAPLASPLSSLSPSDGSKRLVASYTPAAARLTNVDEGAGIGSVIAVELMKVLADDHGSPPSGRLVLKVMVLDEPWRYTRVRVRIERNAADVAGEGVADINPAFEMVGSFSAWSSHGRDPSSINLGQLVARGYPVVVARLTPAPSDVSLSTFLAGPGPFHYGDVIGAAIDASFIDLKGARQPLWNAEQARSAAFGVSGMILQTRPDLHPRYAQQEQTSPTGRDEEIPRLHLSPIAPSSGLGPSRTFENLLAGIDKASVPSPHHYVRIVWANAGGEAMLTCTWPVVFAA